MSKANSSAKVHYREIQVGRLLMPKHPTRSWVPACATEVTWRLVRGNWLQFTALSKGLVVPKSHFKKFPADISNSSESKY